MQFISYGTKGNYHLLESHILGLTIKINIILWMNFVKCNHHRWKIQLQFSGFFVLFFLFSFHLTESSRNCATHSFNYGVSIYEWLLHLARLKCPTFLQMRCLFHLSFFHNFYWNNKCCGIDKTLHQVVRSHLISRDNTHCTKNLCFITLVILLLLLLYPLCLQCIDTFYLWLSVCVCVSVGTIILLIKMLNILHQL